MAQDFVQVAPNSTGVKMHTRAYVVGANTVDDQYVIPTSDRTRTGLYRVTTAASTITVAADGATVGRWWLINPVGSAVAVAVKRVSFTCQHNTALATPTGPRITLERVTFTGTASGAVITPAKRVRTAVAGLTADATNVASVRTASTGLTLTAGEGFKTFMPVVALTTAAACPPAQDDYDPDDEAFELILAAGEGVVCRQADAGTTSDTRRWINTISWEEFTAS